MRAEPLAERDTAAEYMDGERRALRAIDSLHGDPDAMLRAIANCLAVDGAIVRPTPRLTGFARALRKALEDRG